MEAHITECHSGAVTHVWACIVHTSIAPILDRLSEVLRAASAIFPAYTRTVQRLRGVGHLLTAMHHFVAKYALLALRTAYGARTDIAHPKNTSSICPIAEVT